jgi:hypothetical protein
MMLEATRLRELQGMALGLAAATTDDEARQKLLSIAEDFAAQASALEKPKEGPPLSAT